MSVSFHTQDRDDALDDAARGETVDRLAEVLLQSHVSADHQSRHARAARGLGDDGVRLLTGLEVAAATTQASPGTQVVFVTAYDQYAIDAFDRGAIDYLLKPIAAERLAATVQRLKLRAASGATDAAALSDVLARLGAALPGAPSRPPLTWLTASAGRETRLILVDDVAYFRADNKYTTVMTREGEALLRTPIRELLAVLDPGTFKQIHRSTIVNLKAIASIIRDDTGRGIVRLKDRAETLTVSQPFMHLFRHM